MKTIDKIICIALTLIGFIGLFSAGMFVGAIIESGLCCWEMGAGVPMGILVSIGGFWSAIEHLINSFSESDKR